MAWLLDLSLSSVLSDGSEHSCVNHGPLNSLQLNMVYFARIFEPLLVLRITFGMLGIPWVVSRIELRLVKCKPSAVPAVPSL